VICGWDRLGLSDAFAESLVCARVVAKNMEPGNKSRSNNTSLTLLVHEPTALAEDVIKPEGEKV